MKTLRLWLIGAALAASPSSGSTAPVCEAGKGYVAVDNAQQLQADFLLKLKSAGIGTVIRYYDWAEETLPGKTLTSRELSLIAKADMSVAVIFQHHNDCLCTFMRKGRGTRDARRALELAKSFSQPAGSAIYFGIDGSTRSSSPFSAWQSCRVANRRRGSSCTGMFASTSKRPRRRCNPPDTRSGPTEAGWSVRTCSIKNSSTIAG